MKRVVIIILCCLTKKSLGYLKDLGEVLNNTNDVDLFLDNLGVKMEPKIIGGQPSTKVYPSAVLFLNKINFCGGVIINTKIVLTAAHCLEYGRDKNEMKVFANVRYIFDKAADTHSVWDYTIHEKYGDPVEFSNDIALVMIQNKFWYKPASLITNKEWMNETDSEEFRVTGWGMVNKKGDYPETGLQVIHLRFVPLTKCEAMLQTVLSPDMFCLWGGGSKGACQGDSGGGVTWRGKLVGIVSHGNACGRDPGVYTNVLHTRTWIEHNVHGLHDKYCSYHKSDAGEYD